MATSNERIRDELIAHEIELLRFKRGFGNRLVRILNRAEPELRERLKRRIQTAARIGYDRGPATTNRLRRIAQAIRKIQSESYKELRSTVRLEMLELAQMEGKFMSATIAGSLPVVVDPALPDTAQIRSIITKTPINGALLSEWTSQLQANDRRRMMNEIREGLLFNETPTQISRRIFGTQNLNGSDGVKEITRRGSIILAFTVTAAIANAIKAEVYEMNKAIIAEEIYIATLDSRTSPICRSLDGNRYPVGEGPQPPVHIRCRSTRAPIIDGRKLGDRPANAATESQLEGLRGPARRKRVKELVGRVPSQTTYQEWLRGRTASFQDEVLGPTRGKLFRENKITLDQFVDETGRQYTLDQLRQRLNISF
jgi:SPP1 gp7 family putative phage head morphogenesis protein